MTSNKFRPRTKVAPWTSWLEQVALEQVALEQVALEQVRRNRLGLTSCLEQVARRISGDLDQKSAH